MGSRPRHTSRELGYNGRIMRPLFRWGPGLSTRREAVGSRPSPAPTGPGKATEAARAVGSSDVLTSARYRRVWVGDEKRRARGGETPRTPKASDSSPAGDTH